MNSQGTRILFTPNEQNLSCHPFQEIPPKSSPTSCLSLLPLEFLKAFYWEAVPLDSLSIIKLLSAPHNNQRKKNNPPLWEGRALAELVFRAVQSFWVTVTAQVESAQTDSAFQPFLLKEKKPLSWHVFSGGGERYCERDMVMVLTSLQAEAQVTVWRIGESVIWNIIKLDSTQ